MRNALLMLALIWLSGPTMAQVNFNAHDVIPPYDGVFRPGANLDYFPNWTTNQLAELASGKPAAGILGVGARTIRPVLAESVLEIYGYNTLIDEFDYWESLGLDEFAATLGFPVEWHRDFTEYCPGSPSQVMFANLHTPIWDGGANGTPYNDENFFAAYVYKTVSTYNEYVKFWEVLNEPGFDFTGQKGWRGPGDPVGNWWDNDPEPCDYILQAPIENYVRTIRIAYEIIKSIAPEDYVIVGGLGYQSFMDAILRNTDNPNGGSPTPEYPYGAGAYFDILGLHSYPHIDGTTYLGNINFFERHSDRAAEGLTYQRDFFQEILDNYGYDGATYPRKLTLATELNVPRSYDPNAIYFNSDIGQRNYIMKTFITAILNDVIQFNVYGLSDDPGAQFGFDKMGLYQDLSLSNPGSAIANEEAVAMKATADMLWNTTYDANRTAQLNPPSGVKAYAFQRQDGRYLYMMWAETTIDRSEFAEGTFSFPASFGYTTLDKFEWNYPLTNSNSPSSANNIFLNATPIFLVEQGSVNPGSIQLTCPANISVTIVGGSGTNITWNEPVVNSTCANPGVSLNQTEGAANGSFFPLGVSQISYSASNNCGQSTSCSFTVSVNTEGPLGEYCDQGAAQPWEEWIERVEFANIDNTSGKCDPECGYGDFTSLVANLNQGSSYPIRLSPGKGWPGHDSDLFWQVWIDFNGDMDFDDAGELVLQQYGSNQVVDGNIQIPSQATLGQTRMRIAASKGSQVALCEDFDKGEVEDYGINIGQGSGGCNLTGQACDDGDACTILDTFDPNCVCVGTFVDTDFDGVCDAEDQCPGFNDNNDTNNNGIPDDCENIGPGEYCAAQGEAPWQQYISNVNIGNINNETFKCDVICGYGDYSYLSTPVEKGGTYTLELTASYSWQAGNEFWRVWVDWNGDFMFSSSEMVYEVLTPNLPDGVGSNVVNATFVVPNNAVGGNVRVRVALSHTNYVGPCEIYGQGEVEDYSLNIIGTESAVSSREEPNNNAEALQSTDKKIRLYPNPTYGKLYVELNDYASKEGTISISNNFGQILSQQELQDLNEQVLFYDISRFPAGVYYLIVQGKGEKMKVERFSVIKL